MTELPDPPHANELPLSRRLRLYLAGVQACDAYERERKITISNAALRAIERLSGNLEARKIAYDAIERIEE